MPLLLSLLLLFGTCLAARSSPLRAPNGPHHVVASISSAAKAAAAPGRYNGSLKIGKLKRYFIAVVPEPLPGQKTVLEKGLAPAAKLPVVIVLHGALGNPWSVQMDTGLTERASKQGFLVVYPYGTGLGNKQVLFWNAGGCCALAMNNHVDDVSFIRELIVVLKRDYNADPQRIYVAGASNGGMMAYKLAAELSGQIAAIASVEGCMFPPACAPTSPVSVIALHGTADSVVPYAGGTGMHMGYKVRNVAAAGKTVDYWVNHNHCRPLPQKLWLDGIVKETYGGGGGGSEVCLITLSGGRHGWPGGCWTSITGNKASRNLKASDEILDFFIKHPKQ